jgi:hypothetical protein
MARINHVKRQPTGGRHGRLCIACSPESYWRPTEQELLQDYLKAVPLLSVSNTSANLVLQRQVQELKEKSTGSEMITKSALKEKDQEIQALRMEMAEVKKMMTTLVEKVEVNVTRATHSKSS